MIKKILAYVLSSCMIFSLGVLSPNKVFACSCFYPSIEEKFERSSVVFTGTLVSKDKEGGNVFSVEKVWKGDLTDGYVYSGFSGMCGTEFDIGSEYLVYTYNSKGKESTSLCSGNKLITDANEEIQVLDQLTEPVWKNKYVLILLFAFAAGFSIIIWRVRLRFKKGL